jgi:hypothetical protein
VGKKIDPAIAVIRGTRGMAVRIAEALGIDKQGVYQWKRVPPLRVQIVSEIIGMPPEKNPARRFQKIIAGGAGASDESRRATLVAVSTMRLA